MKKEAVPETAYGRSVPVQNGLTQPGGLTPGQAIVMTGWAGAEGAAILAEEREAELKSIFPGDLVDEAKAYGDRRSNLPAETVAAQCGASAVYQILDNSFSFI